MNYELRGKCKEYSEQLVTERPDLRLVRGHYWCPIWNSNEQCDASDPDDVRFSIEAIANASARARIVTGATE